MINMRGRTPNSWISSSLGNSRANELSSLTCWLVPERVRLASGNSIWQTKKVSGAWRMTECCRRSYFCLSKFRSGPVTLEAARVFHVAQPLGTARISGFPLCPPLPPPLLHQSISFPPSFPPTGRKKCTGHSGDRLTAQAARQMHRR